MDAWILESKDTGLKIRVYPHTLTDTECLALQSSGTIMLGDETFHLVTDSDQVED